MTLTKENISGNFHGIIFKNLFWIFFYLFMFFRYLFYIFIVGTCSFGYNDPFFVISYFLANDMGSLRFLNQTGILAYIFHWKKIIGSLSTSCIGYSLILDIFQP